MIIYLFLVFEWINEEKKIGLDNILTSSLWKNFQTNMIQTKYQLKQIISDICQNGGMVVGYGAPARATTLSAFLGFDWVKKHIKYVIDDAPAKQGKFMPATHIPIVNSSILSGQNRVDYLLVFAWPWVEEIARKNPRFLEQGGKMIRPLSDVQILDKNSFS